MSAASLPVVVHHWTAVSSAGTGVDALVGSLAARRGGLRRNDFPGCQLDAWIGRVSDDTLGPLPARLGPLDSRNNRLCHAGLQTDGFLEVARAAVRRFGAARVGVIIGTSTSSIGRTEEGYARLDAEDRFPPPWIQPEVQNPHSPAHLVALLTGAGGPDMTIGTACSSSAKVFAAAARWLHAGISDAVVVGGVDSLCLSVLYGFHSLQLVSARPCRPFDAGRDGISIGEAAGFALLARAGDLPARCRLVGFGESSDAHHMSSPHPEGLGAELAMREALERASLDAGDVDYVNLHGTASRQNDTVEAEVLGRLMPRVTASSTKGWTGHTLGAAGILEAVIVMEALRRGFMPGTLNTTEVYPDCPAAVAVENVAGVVRHAMSNSFGFGGSNCSLLFAAEAA